MITAGFQTWITLLGVAETQRADRGSERDLSNIPEAVGSAWPLPDSLKAANFPDTSVSTVEEDTSSQGN